MKWCLLVVWSGHSVGFFPHFCFLFIIILSSIVLSVSFLMAVISPPSCFPMQSSSRYIDASKLSLMPVSHLPPSFLDTYILSTSSLWHSPSIYSFNKSEMPLSRFEECWPPPTESLPELPLNLNIVTLTLTIWPISSDWYWLPCSSHSSSSLTDSLPSMNLLCHWKTEAWFMQDGREAVWSIPYVSVAYFPSLKHNSIA